MTPTPGDTYTTCHGEFTIMDWDAEGYAVLLRRADGRYLLAAQSDWHTWDPQPAGSITP